MRGWIRLPSPAMGVALIALTVALGGTTYAAVRIGTKQIRDNAITSPKIRNGAVRNIDLARNSVVTAKIVAGAVTGLQIKDASVGNADLGNDSVTGSKVRGGAIGNSDLATDAVTTTKLRAGAVGNTDIADGAVSTLPDGASATPLLTAPGLGVLRASCSGGVATTQWSNTAATPVVVTNQALFHDTTAVVTGDLDYVHEATVAAGAATDQTPNIGVNGVESVTWQASVDDAAGDHVATVWVTASASGTGCRLAAQGLSTV
jgi:hypothetical protein